MKLVEADAQGPAAIEEAPPHPTPPRPEHRRVYVSFLFTLVVLVGTVVTIYAVFPARHNALLVAAVAEHRRADATWELERPAPDVLETWALGVLGKRAPVPPPAAGDVVGARTIEVLNRRAAVIRYKLAGGDVTLVVQRARDVKERRVSKQDGDDEVEQWQRDGLTVIAVGPAASAAAWKPRMGVP